jgi:hypothetical protein
MNQEIQLSALKNLIETGNLHEFKDIFLYVEKKFIFLKLGGNYGTFLKYIENPKKFRYEHTYRLATILQVTPQQVSEMIHNQIDNSKKKTVKSISKKK